MRFTLTFLAAATFAFCASAQTPASDDGTADAIRASVAAFIDEEGGAPDDAAAARMTDCIIETLADLDDETRQSIAELDDFEDSLEFVPAERQGELEDEIETCLD